jgi:cytochrome c biogenesis protein CcmG/thiol:disulfide interchange protein DsbE
MTTTAPEAEQPSLPVAPRRRRMRIALWAALAVGVVVLGFAVVLASQVGNDPTYRGGKVLDKPAPTLDLPLLTGGKLTSAELKGKSVMVNFWNSWCIPCQRELPTLKTFAEQHKNEPDVVLLGIVRDDTKDAVQAYVVQNGITWPVALDPDARAALDFGTTGQPETYAIATDGVVVAQQFGEVSIDSLNTMLACTKGQCARG